MTWFEKITGFTETDYASTRARLRVEGTSLCSIADGKHYGMGVLEIPTLAELRERAAPHLDRAIRSTVRNTVGNVRELHAQPAMAGALFQVASQFNLLEMIGPEVSPEQGVTRYQHDRTQGPACAMAAGAATIYRNYLVPLEGTTGQTRERQINTLAGLGQRLAELTGIPPEQLWTMRNGYALASDTGLDAIANYLQTATEDQRQVLRGLLQIGWHRGVEVTDVADPPRPIVSQAFCSALPVAYSRLPASRWQAFARLVLEAAYEATLLATCIEAAEGGSNRVLLTRLGGGAFGNADQWIDDAIERGLQIVEHAGLDVLLVHFAQVPESMRELERRWG